MKVAYFDCFSGAGGDMIVGSLLDAGADEARLRKDLTGLNLRGYTLSIEKVKKQGFAATRFAVDLDDSLSQPHRHLADIVQLIERSTLSSTVKVRGIQVFERLAAAEAKVHGMDVNEVHFHEVGAVDSIIDILGAVWALDNLGIERVYCSVIPTGSGTVTCQHGVMPVPAPATAELLKGVPIVGSEEVGELTTPTAAAILTTVSDRFGPIPRMSVDSIGCGAGTRDGSRMPNVLRVLLGRTSDDDGEVDEIAVLETNLDDASPELIAHCTQRLFEEGALDVYTVPIHMKKSRSGLLLAVLCEPDRVPSIERTIFAETTTFGIRRHSVTRTTMRRWHKKIDTPYGEIRMKVGQFGEVVTTSPEFEDCRVAAAKHGVALREVLAAAHAAWAVRRG